MPQRAGVPIEFPFGLDAPAFLREGAHDIRNSLSGQFHQTVAPSDPVAKTKLAEPGFSGLFGFHIPLYQTPAVGLKNTGTRRIARHGVPIVIESQFTGDEIAPPGSLFPALIARLGCAGAEITSNLSSSGSSSFG